MFDGHVIVIEQPHGAPERRWRARDRVAIAAELRHRNEWTGSSTDDEIIDAHARTLVSLRIIERPHWLARLFGARGREEMYF